MMGKSRNRPVFFAFWHGRQLPLIHTHRNEGINVLVSRNRDGQYVTNVLHSMGFGTVRGSSSKGGMEAVRIMSMKLRNGSDCAITPDGPRGPAEKAKTGLAHIARLGKLPVIPMGTSAWPAIRFSSWDGFILPLPFARVSVIEGRPIHPPVRGDDPVNWTETVETELNRVTSIADLLTSPSARLYTAALKLLGTLVHPFASIALLFRPKRERLERKGIVRRPRNRPVWLHGSSLGELNGLLPCAEYLKEKGIPVWITCYTPTGRSFIDRMGFEGSFIPLDISQYAERFITRLRPRAFILTETEIWPNTINCAVTYGIPCMMINARLSEKSVKGYRILGSLPAAMLSCFTGILTRSSEDLERFIRIGVNERILSVSGDTKILKDHGDPPPEWRDYIGDTGKPVIVAGSTREGEEEDILSAARNAGYFPVIVPRHLDRINDVHNIMLRLGYTPVKWSDLTETSDRMLDFDSILVDVHGVLAQIYGIGDAAFVGGTLVPIGGHNVLEPVMRGLPLIVGPYYSSFGTIVDILVENDIAHIASSQDEIASILHKLDSTSSQIKSIRGMFESIKQSILNDFESMLVSSGITESDRVNEKT